MSLARVHQFSISLDGFGTGEPQSLDAPFGHAGERLHEWMFATRWWGEMVGQPGGSRGIDDAFLRLHDSGVGAEIMGAGKFGYPGWHEDPEWKGWWGANPPFHTPVFVLTHHPRPAFVEEWIAFVSLRISFERLSSSSFCRSSSLTVCHCWSAITWRLASARFWLIITKVERKIASSETIIVSRP